MTRTNYLSFALLLPLLSAKFVSSRENNLIGRTQCYTAFALAGFDIFDFENYPKYFNEDSYMQLAQSGAYYGPDGIEEYVRFASPTSPYISVTRQMDSSSQVKTASDPETGDCVITVVDTTSLKFSNIAKKDYAITRSGFIKVFFKRKAFNEILINKIFIYFDVDYIYNFFGDGLNTDGVRQNICSTMENNCPDVWDLNGLSTEQECLDELAALPLVGDEGDASGNTQTCRVLHNAFAGINTNHCEHISFVAAADVNGAEKCQESAFRPVGEMFDDEDLEVFEDKRKELGVALGGVECYCPDEELSFWDNSKLVWNHIFLSAAGLLPTAWKCGEMPYCAVCFD